MQKEIDAVSVHKKDQIFGHLPRLRSLITSQSQNLKNLSALVVFNFAAAGLFFITQIKIANTIGKEQFGLLAYGIAIGMYGQAIVRYGMDRTLVRDLIHYPKRFSELVIASLLLRGILLGTVISALLVWKLIWQPVDLSWAVIIIIIAYSIKSLDLQAVYDAWQKMAHHATYNLIRRSIYFVAVLLIIYSVPNNLTLAIVGSILLVAEIIYLILQHQWAFHRIDLNTIKAPVTKTVKELTKSNSWIWLATMGTLSWSSLNQIILKHYCGASELGGYAASWQLAIAVTLLLSQVARIGNPATARTTRLEINKLARIHFLLRYSVVMLLIAAPICFSLFFFPELILKTIFKPEYALAAGILRIFSIYLLILSFGVVASQYIVSARMEKTYFISVILGGCLSVIFCVILIPKLSGIGAAISLLIAHGFSMGLYWVAMIRHVQKQQ